jgi:hypothetical protein
MPHDSAIIQQGLEAIQGGMSIRAAAARFQIPEPSLRRYWHLYLTDTPRALHGGTPSLPPQVEIQLASVVKVASASGFGFTTEEIKEFVGAYVREQWYKDDDVAHYLQRHCRFGADKIPGKDWMSNFMRNHHLSLKSPGSLEKCRKTAEADPFLIYEFYDLLEESVRSLNLSERPQCIWNLDESPFWIDPKGGKVVGEIGVKTQRVTSGTGRTCLSVLGCVSAAGRALPPLIIFQGKNLYASWKGTSADIPPGTTYACSGKGQA